MLIDPNTLDEIGRRVDRVIAETRELDSVANPAGIWASLQIQVCYEMLTTLLRSPEPNASEVFAFADRLLLMCARASEYAAHARSGAGQFLAESLRRASGGGQPS